MAHFMGTMQGNRGSTSRLGSKSSGIDAQVSGWNIGVDVRCHYDPETDSDICHIYQTGGSNRRTGEKLIKTIREKRRKPRKR